MIPLQDEAGIVEWVPNTRGIRHCLQDTYTAEGLFDGKTTNVTIKRMYDTFAVGGTALLLTTLVWLGWLRWAGRPELADLSWPVLRWSAWCLIRQPAACD